MHMKGTDHPVVVLKVLLWGWSEGDEPARDKRWSTPLKRGMSRVLFA
jgi:hypothetical protein